MVLDLGEPHEADPHLQGNASGIAADGGFVVQSTVVGCIRLPLVCSCPCKLAVVHCDAEWATVLLCNRCADAALDMPTYLHTKLLRIAQKSTLLSFSSYQQSQGQAELLPSY